MSSCSLGAGAICIMVFWMVGDGRMALMEEDCQCSGVVVVVIVGVLGLMEKRSSPAEGALFVEGVSFTRSV
jgi:hypothetical protein